MDQASLQSLWEHTRNQINPTELEWSRQLQTIYACGRGLQETLQYLHLEQPGFDDFISWMTIPGNSVIPPGITADVLLPEDLSFFEQHGYLVLRQAVERTSCAESCT